MEDSIPVPDVGAPEDHWGRGRRWRHGGGRGRRSNNFFFNCFFKYCWESRYELNLGFLLLLLGARINIFGSGRGRRCDGVVGGWGMGRGHVTEGARG